MKEINIGIITVEEPFYTYKILEKLITISPKSMNFVTIILVPSKPRQFSTLGYLRNRIELYGISQFSKVVLLFLSRRLLDLFSIKAYSVAKVAKKNNIMIIKTSSLKNDWFLDQLKSLSLDVILSISCPLKFSKELLTLPKLGCLNVHPGKLPKYRGVQPGFWTLLNQEKEGAVTVHYMNEEYDDGDIIQQDVFEIKDIDTIHKMHLKVLEIAPKTIIKSLTCLTNDKIPKIKNDSSNSTYFSFPTKEDGKRLRELGIKFI